MTLKVVEEDDSEVNEDETLLVRKFKTPRMSTIAINVGTHTTLSKTILYGMKRNVSLKEKMWPNHPQTDWM